MDDAVAALEEVERDYEGHCAAAEEIARSFFCHEVVLTRLLSSVGAELSRSLKRQQARGSKAFPGDMSLATVSRRPTALPRSTVETTLRRPLPPGVQVPPLDAGSASLVVVTHDNLVFTRLCLESVLAHTGDTGHEIIVVDNGSGDDTPEYLTALAERNSHVRVVLNGANLGFPRACNEGLALARADHLVLLNNDTLVPPRWLPRLLSHIGDASVGLVGPATNRIGNEAEIETDYRTWSEFLDFAERRAGEHPGEGIDIPVASMFCLAMRRDVFERLGPLDERYEIGLLEDDDYSERARRAGLRVRCADDVFVHHFSEASFGKLVPTGEYADILRENKQRYVEKWRAPWMPYGRRQSTSYRALTQRIRELVVERVPPDATVLVVSRGDDELLGFEGRLGVHFPQAENGVYAGHYPADSAEAIEHLETLRARGGGYFLIPRTSFWWLDHYDGLGVHLAARYRELHREEACVVFELNGSS